jgi:hypothetical protein
VDGGAGSELCTAVMGLWTHGGATSCAVLLCVCCEGATPPSRSPTASLPPYSVHDAELFDDAIEAAAAGYQGADQGVAPKKDALLRERTQTGDAVVRARVVTVTSSLADDGHSWQIGLHTVENLAGKRPPDTDFTFRIDGQGAAAGIVRALEARLVGTMFVVFLREFSPGKGESEQGGREIHFHFGRDDAAELGAVREASLLGEVR